MIFKELGFVVFLFIIRIRFPKGKSIADILRGESFARKICKFEKNHDKLRKGHLDLELFLRSSRAFAGM